MEKFDDETRMFAWWGTLVAKVESKTWPTAECCIAQKLSLYASQDGSKVGESVVIEFTKDTITEIAKTKRFEPSREVDDMIEFFGNSELAKALYKRINSEVKDVSC